MWISESASSPALEHFSTQEEPVAIRWPMAFATDRPPAVRPDYFAQSELHASG